jgi:hypothetical protein
MKKHCNMRNLISLLCLLSCTSVAGQQNVALNRAVYHSSAIDYDKVGHLITDGSEKTSWQSKTGADHWVAIDLGAVTPVTKVKISWGDNSGLVYKIQTALREPELAEWTDVYATTRGKGGVEEITLPAGASARSVRIYISSVKELRRSSSVSIKEVEIDGEKKVILPERRQPFLTGGNTLALDDGNWKVQNESFLTVAGEELSSPAYDDSNWIPAKVPGTILGSYLAIGALPDPYYSDQNELISESFFTFSNFWYRNTFRVPPSFAPGSRLYMAFEGVNWKSRIYINGKLAGLIDGAFRRARFDVTDLLYRDKDNAVTVFIQKLDHATPWPRKVLRKFIGAPTVNGDFIGYDSPTFMAASGWNWQPIVRGRNLGIWNTVTLESGSTVEIKDPYIVNTLNLPDTTKALLTFKTDIRNYASTPQEGTLKLQFLGQTYRQKVTLPPDRTGTVTIGNIKVSHPALWWPNGYGNPVLHNVEVTFENQTGTALDTKSFKHGIRDLQSKVENNILYVYVNGTKLLIRGGNWGLPEALLNCDEAGFDLRVRLHRDANFNMIRNWVGQNTHRYLYEACDRYGILIYDDFWLANAVDGPDPTDNTLFMNNAKDKIRHFRHHASLAFYCGRNESYPPAELDKAMREAVSELDGSRYYASHSAADEFTGLGPYDIMSKEWYFANRGKTFHSEQGIIAFPVVESLRQMMPEQYWWPVNDMWAIHDYQTPRSLLFTQTLQQRYGIPSNEEEYTRKAQMLNMESSKAIFESLQNNRGSGVLIWMSQSSWPSMICQLYDHYFEPTASFFGAKRACSPIHIFWNPLNNMLRVANNSLKPLHNVTAHAGIYDVKGNLRHTKEIQLDVNEGEAADGFELPVRKDKLDLIRLQLKAGDTLLAENFYWTQDADESCQELLQLPATPLTVTCRKEVVDGETIVTATIANKSKAPAINIRLGIHDAQDRRVLPVFYSDNYFSLLPGDKKEVRLSYKTEGESSLFVEGWNVDRTYNRLK